MNNKITLDVLVDYLVDNKVHLDIDSDQYSVSNNDKNDSDNFNLKFLEHNNSSNFYKFNKYFKNHIDCIGVYVNGKKGNNISLLSSILFCIDEDFCTLDFNEQCYYIKYINNKIINDTNSRKFKIKNLSNQMIISNLKNIKSINNLDIYIYASYLKLNIFIFDFVNDDIRLYYPENELNIYKPNIFISKCNDQYNPLVYKNNNGRILKYNSSILEDIIYTNEMNIFSLNDKQFVICNNWDILLKNYEKKNFKNIIVDLREEDNLLLQQMIDSDDSGINVDYESDNSKNSHDFDNLTEELENINNQTNELTEIDSDNISLSSNNSEEINSNEVNNNVDIDIELLNKVKSMSKNKLLKEKKDVLIDYIIKLFNKEKDDIHRLNKVNLVSTIQNELNKNI